MYVNPVNGTTLAVANISGHRDWAATECPGGNLYALLPAIRDAAAGTTPPPPPPPPDTTPPVITAVAASTTANSATVSWTTDEMSTGSVEYRRTKTTVWTSMSDPASPWTSHSITIPGLTSRTSYQYRVTSRDGSGNSATSAIFSFKTR